MCSPPPPPRWCQACSCDLSRPVKYDWKWQAPSPQKLREQFWFLLLLFSTACLRQKSLCWIQKTHSRTAVELQIQVPWAGNQSPESWIIQCMSIATTLKWSHLNFWFCVKYHPTQFFLPSHGLQCLPLQTSVPSTLSPSLGFETVFGQWDTWRSGGSRGLRCACAIGLALTVTLWTWEEMPQIARAPEKCVDQSLLGSLVALTP